MKRSKRTIAVSDDESDAEVESVAVKEDRKKAMRPMAKAPRKKGSIFIDDQAGNDDDDDEEDEEDEEDEDEDDDDDDHELSEFDDSENAKQNAELDAINREKEAVLDGSDEEFIQHLEELADVEVSDEDEIHAPTSSLFMVRCSNGKETQSVAGIWENVRRHEIEILSVMCTDTKGCILIEVESQGIDIAKMAVREIPFVRAETVESVSATSALDAIRNSTTAHNACPVGSWVRVTKKGRYKNTLGLVLSTNGTSAAIIRMIPRIRTLDGHTVTRRLHARDAKDLGFTNIALTKKTTTLELFKEQLHGVLGIGEEDVIALPSPSHTIKLKVCVRLEEETRDELMITKSKLMTLADHVLDIPSTETASFQLTKHKTTERFVIDDDAIENGYVVKQMSSGQMKWLSVVDYSEINSFSSGEVPMKIELHDIVKLKDNVIALILGKSEKNIEVHTSRNCVKTAQCTDIQRQCVAASTATYNGRVLRQGSLLHSSSSDPLPGSWKVLQIFENEYTSFIWVQDQHERKVHCMQCMKVTKQQVRRRLPPQNSLSPEKRCKVISGKFWGRIGIIKRIRDEMAYVEFNDALRQLFPVKLKDLSSG